MKRRLHHVRAKCVWLCFHLAVKTSVHFLALPSPQKATGFSGTPEVLTEKVRILKHLLHHSFPRHVGNYRNTPLGQHLLVFRLSPHRGELVLECYFPLIVRKKTRIYVSMSVFFYFSETKNTYPKTATHPKDNSPRGATTDRGICLSYGRNNRICLFYEKTGFW